MKDAPKPVPAPVPVPAPAPEPVTTLPRLLRLRCVVPFQDGNILPRPYEAGEEVSVSRPIAQQLMAAARGAWEVIG